jgi:hypothetical protein
LQDIKPLLKACFTQKRRKGWIAVGLFQYEDWETQINAYLHGELSEEACQGFETAMAENLDLKAAVDFEAVFAEQVQRKLLFQHFKPQMDAYFAGVVPTPALTSPSFWKWGLSGLAILGLGWNFYALRQEQQHQALMQQWLQPLPYGRTNMAETKDSLALKAYLEGRFADAEAIFSANDALLPVRGEGSELYRAVNAILAEQSQRAIPILTARLKEMETQPIFQPEVVRWYLAMAYLQQKDYPNAKRILQTIDNQAYADKAKQLLNLLK